MSDTIRILSKKAFRFKKPGVGLLDTNFAIAKQPEFSDMYYDTVPGEIQTAPAWIKHDAMWRWAIADGDLMEIRIEPQVGAGTDPQVAAAIASAQNQSDAANRGLQTPPPEGENDELGGYGQEQHPTDVADSPAAQTGDTPEAVASAAPASTPAPVKAPSKATGTSKKQQ